MNESPHSESATTANTPRARGCKRAIGVIIRAVLTNLVLMSVLVAAGNQNARPCVSFESSRLNAGTAYAAPIGGGLEFRLSPTWTISVGPAGDHAVDYLQIVSPPFRTAPHIMIGPGYGLTASESAAIERPLRFVLDDAAYEAARIAHSSLPAAELLIRLRELALGSVKLSITAFAIRKTLPSGEAVDAFEWIQFNGVACTDGGSPARRGRYLLNEN